MGDWILDPVYPSLTVSNLILVKEGDKTKVNGQIELKSDANSANIGVNLSFLNEKGDKIGFIVISGDYKAGISYFEIAGDGDFVAVHFPCRGMNGFFLLLVSMKFTMIGRGGLRLHRQSL